MNDILLMMPFRSEFRRVVLGLLSVQMFGRLRIFLESDALLKPHASSIGRYVRHFDTSPEYDDLRIEASLLNEIGRPSNDDLIKGLNLYSALWIAFKEVLPHELDSPNVEYVKEEPVSVGNNQILCIDDLDCFYLYMSQVDSLLRLFFGHLLTLHAIESKSNFEVP